MEKLEDCYSPWLLKDMDRAVEEILKAVKEGLHIGSSGIMMWTESARLIS